jgi:chromate reductase
MATLNVVSICGSLRKGSYNRMVMNALPGLAPEGMQIREAPPYHEFRITTPHSELERLSAV